LPKKIKIKSERGNEGHLHINRGTQVISLPPGTSYKESHAL